MIFVKGKVEREDFNRGKKYKANREFEKGNV